MALALWEPCSDQTPLPKLTPGPLHIPDMPPMTPLPIECMAARLTWREPGQELAATSADSRERFLARRALPALAKRLREARLCAQAVMSLPHNLALNVTGASDSNSSPHGLSRFADTALKPSVKLFAWSAAGRAYGRLPYMPSMFIFKGVPGLC